MATGTSGGTGPPRAARPARRAPRLSPDESIAGLVTRTGRFARIDPRRPREHPEWPRVAGVIAWAAFTAGCGWAAWRRHGRDGER